MYNSQYITHYAQDNNIRSIILWEGVVNFVSNINNNNHMMAKEITNLLVRYTWHVALHSRNLWSIVHRPLSQMVAMLEKSVRKSQMLKTKNKLTTSSGTQRNETMDHNL